MSLGWHHWALAYTGWKTVIEHTSVPQLTLVEIRNCVKDARRKKILLLVFSESGSPGGRFCTGTCGTGQMPAGLLGACFTFYASTFYPWLSQIYLICHCPYEVKWGCFYLPQSTTAQPSAFFSLACRYHGKIVCRSWTPFFRRQKLHPAGIYGIWCLRTRDQDQPC